jgi:hypothetical protein
MVLLLAGMSLPTPGPAAEFIADGKTFPEISQAAPRVRKMLDDAVDLTKRDLDYLYGVADPERGFDCSGMVFYLLLQMGAPHVPRQANTLYEYLAQKNAFHAARKSTELGDLEPGDLLFWTGTYNIDRKVTHVMIYLGMEKGTGQRWMVGAASRNIGVGVFRFNPGSPNGIGRNFIGFGKLQAFFKPGTFSPAPPPVQVASVQKPQPISPKPAAPTVSDADPRMRPVNTYFGR